MAGDCPHRDEIANTIKNFHEQKSVIAANHLDYVALIDELKCELDNLVLQVTMVQQELCESEKDKQDQIETSLKELESQNDLLQEALVQATKEKNDVCINLEQNNENLLCQIEHMQRTICEKEQRIAQLNAMLTHLQLEDGGKASDCCLGKVQSQEIQDIRQQLEQANRKVESLLSELGRSQKQERFLMSETRKLNDELIDIKRKNGDLNIQTRRLAGLLKSQEKHRLELSKKYESIEENYEDQAKKLRAATAQLNHLQERYALMEKRSDEHNMERNLLRNEVLALKEKEATLLGRQKSIQEHLIKSERELFTAHDVLKEQQCIHQRNEMAHKEVVKRLYETINDMKRQYNMVLDDNKKLQLEYEKETECRKQNAKIIESYRKWKESQIQADEATRASFKQYEEHIKLLLEEKQKFLEEYRNLHRDYEILQNELDRFKMCQISTSAKAATGATAASASANNSENSIVNRIELIRRTSRRLSEQGSSLRSNGDNIMPASSLPASKYTQELH